MILRFGNSVSVCTMVVFVAALSWTSCLAAAQPTTGAKPAAAKKDTFFIIPHTHWEGAVFKTREEYLEMGLPNILKAIYLLKKYPDYRFVLDQVAYVKPFIERYPEQAMAFRQFVKEGRLQLVLGMDVMPDLNIPGGETLLRQIEYGKTYYRQTFGVDVTVGWFLDTFGHNGQMPQILTLAGYKSFWSQRGEPSESPLGVSLGRDRRHVHPRLPAAAQLRPALWSSRQPGPVQRLRQAALGACRLPMPPGRIAWPWRVRT